MADIKTALVQKINTDLPDQSVGGITPVIQRGVLTAVVDVLQDIEDRVEGLPVFTESQRAGLAYIVEQSGGAEGLVLAVAANTDKVSFDPESRATLTRLAGETERSEEDVLALIQSAPISTAVAAEFLSVHGNIDDINGRIDNLPVSETIPQSVLDKIQALEDRLEFTPAEQMTIMANASGVAANAQSVLDLIQSVADANARIDGNRDARRITPQEIQDIVDLKAEIADLEDNLELTQEQSDKINASDAVHAAFESRIKALEDADGGGGLGAEAVDARIDAKQDPSLFQELAGTIPAQRPRTSFVVNAGNSPLTTDPLTLPTTGLTGFKDGEVVRIDGSLYFDGEYTGTAPIVSAEVRQGGDLIKNLYNLPAQGAGPYFFYARLGAGDITITPTASLNTELEATLYPYTSASRVSLLGKYHNVSVELINTQIAIALAETKLQVAQNATDNAHNRAEIAALQQTITTLNNAFQALILRLDNDSLKFLMAGSVVAADNTITQSRTALGDTWKARMEEAGAPYTAQVVVDLTQGSIQYGSTPGSADEKSVLAFENNGWVYGRAFIAAVDHPEQTNQHETTYVGATLVDSQNQFRIDLGVNNQFVASTTSFTPSEDIPDGTIVHVDFHAYVNGTARQIAEIDYEWGSGVAAVHEVDHEGQTSIIGTVREFNGELEVAITQSTAENNLPVDGGYVRVYAHWETTTAPYTSPERVDDVQLMRHTGHAALVVANVNNNIVIYYGAGQSFETNHFAAPQVDFYIINGSQDALGAVYGIDAAASYDLTALQANANSGVDYLGFFVDVPHATNQVVLPGGMVLTGPAGKEWDIVKILEELMAAGGQWPPVARITLTGAEIKSGSYVFPEVPEGSIFVKWGMSVLVSCPSARSITGTLNNLANAEQIDISLNVKEKNSGIRVAGNAGIFRDGPGGVFLLLDSNTTPISDECQIELALSYIMTTDEDLFSG